MSVIDFDAFKNRKKEEESIANSRVPLWKSHLKNKVEGETSNDFADRMGRIKSSLERINYLMSELKKRNDRDRGGLED